MAKATEVGRATKVEKMKEKIQTTEQFVTFFKKIIFRDPYFEDVLLVYHSQNFNS